MFCTSASKVYFTTSNRSTMQCKDTLSWRYHNYKIIKMTCDKGVHKIHSHIGKYEFALSLIWFKYFV